MDSAKLELLAWDFPMSLAMTNGGKLAPSLTQCFCIPWEQVPSFMHSMEA